MQAAFVPPFQSPRVSQHKHLNSMFEGIRESSGKQQSFHFCFQRELWVLDGGGWGEGAGHGGQGEGPSCEGKPKPHPPPPGRAAALDPNRPRGMRLLFGVNQTHAFLKRA